MSYDQKNNKDHPGTNEIAADIEQIADDQPDLLFPPDELALPLPLDAREMYAVESKGVGRPKGSKNKKDVEITQYLLALGYRDPMHGLASIYSMTPVDLAMKVTEYREQLREKLIKQGLVFEADKVPRAPIDPMEALELQKSAMIASLPYWHAKQQPKDAPPSDIRPMMVFNNFSVNQSSLNNDDGTLSAGIMPNEKTIDNQQLNDCVDMRPDSDKSH